MPCNETNAVAKIAASQLKINQRVVVSHEQEAKDAVKRIE
jgi:hypothetical protein